MPSLLVTGGAGFIGSCYVHRQVAARSAGIVNLDKLTYAGNRASLPQEHPERHRFVHGDIGDGALVRRLLAEQQPSSILHFAAESHVDRSIVQPAPFLQTNVIGTCVLLEAALDYFRKLSASEQAAFRFLHISTDEVYGSLGPMGKFTEASPHAPNSPYAASKSAAEMLVRAFHHTHGLPTLITNCSNNYGPRQHPEKLIPRMIQCALAGEPLPIYGDGRQVRDWLHVEDHCAAVDLVLAHGRVGETYNIGASCERENLAVVRQLCDLLDELSPLAGRSYREQIAFVADRPGHDRRYALDATKLETELGWRPTIDFSTGLRATVQWYLANQAWVKTVLAISE